MAFYSRAQWGARKPKSKYIISNLPAPEVWIHHSVTANGPDEIQIMKQIQNYHMNQNKWADIAYSFVVFPSGNIYEGRGWAVVGAHTANHNSKSHAICFAGNFQNEQPTDAAINAARWLISEGKSQGFVKSGTQPTGGHRDVAATACPGNNLYAKIEALREPWGVKPMYDPPFSVSGGVAAHLKAPGGGVWVLGHLGHIYAFDAPYKGAPAGQSYWGDRKAATLKPSPNGQGYTVVATSEEEYTYE